MHICHFIIACMRTAQSKQAVRVATQYASRLSSYWGSSAPARIDRRPMTSY